MMWELGSVPGVFLVCVFFPSGEGCCHGEVVIARKAQGYIKKYVLGNSIQIFFFLNTNFINAMAGG